MRHRNWITLAFAGSMLALLQACAGGSTRVEDEAVRDYIIAAELEETQRIRTPSKTRVSYVPLNERFMIYETLNAHYLVELRRRCHELYDHTRIVPDVRRDSTELRARFDTFRGCYIETIYEIDEAQALELRQLGDAPGDETVEGSVEPPSEG